MPIVREDRPRGGFLRGAGPTTRALGERWAEASARRAMGQPFAPGPSRRSLAAATKWAVTAEVPEPRGPETEAAKREPSADRDSDARSREDRSSSLPMRVGACHVRSRIRQSRKRFCGS